MAMTRKDYEAIAECFKPFNEQDDEIRFAPDMDLSASLLIPVFRESNHRFDSIKWLKACGFSREAIREVVSYLYEDD